MNYFLRSCLWYFSALLTGLVFIWVVLPFLVIDVWAEHLPWQINDQYKLLFGHYCFIRTALIFIAASLSALVGFFMMKNKYLRRATLTMPLWASVFYALIYIGLMYQS